MKIIRTIITNGDYYIGDVVLNSQYKIFFDWLHCNKEFTTAICPYCTKAYIEIKHKYCYNCGVQLTYEKIEIINEG